MLTLQPLATLAMVLGLFWPGATLVQETEPYTAKAGMLAIGADPERPEMEFFHVAYTMEGADKTTRPVTFLVNGGPGGASIFLHVAAIGPLTIAMAGDGSFPPVPARLEPNADSWIDFTDLVFIDPVGTGYSRMLPGPDGTPGDPKPYYAVDSDMQSIAWFMCQWLTENDRWASPKALAGESYGGQRVAGLTRILAQSYGINLNRAVMISPALHAEIAETRYSILGPVTMFPTQAAIAAHYGLNTFDRSLAVLTGILQPPLMDHLRDDLGYKTSRGYIALNIDANLQWDRASGSGGPDDLAIALA